MTELQAQRVMLVRALEQARQNGELWSGADAKEANRATKELVDRKASFDQFVARRAEWVLMELGNRTSGITIDVHSPRWPTVAGWVLIALAMTTGLMTDYLAANHRVDIVEYPLVTLILWNMAVYSWFAVGWLSSLYRSRQKQHGFLLDTFGKWRLLGTSSGSTATQMPWIEQFKLDWLALSGGLNQARLGLALHLAAIFFTLGVLLGLCFRALFKGYLACWETSFVEVSAETIHSIVSVVLAPGAMLLNRPVPDSQHISSLHCQNGIGELAGPWILLYAGSILAWIIIPRLLLATLSGITRWRLQRAFPLPLNGTYFATLRAIRGEHAIGVLAIPFRYELTPQIKNNLTRILERIHGLAVTIAVRPPVLLGEDPKDWKDALGSERHIAVFVIFNVAATAEPDTHGQLLRRILADVDGRMPVIPVVDIGVYADLDRERFQQRCNQWRAVLDEIHCTPLFLNLAKPDDAEFLQALHDRLIAND